MKAVKSAAGTRARVARWSLSCAVLVSSLLTGCAEGEAPEPTVAPPVGDPVAVESQALAEPDAPLEARPVVQSLTGMPLETLSTSTPTFFELRLDAQRAENESFRGKTLLVTPDSGSALVFRDDGQSGDVQAGDLLFSANGTFDFVALQAEQSRIANAQSQSQTQLTFTTFEARQVARVDPIQPLPSSIFIPGQRIPIRPVGLASFVDPARSLVINHPSVVNDPTRTYDPCTNTGNPNGKWTFNYLMTEMANYPTYPVAPPAFVRQWVKQWETPQNINGFTVPARTNILPRITNPWPKLSTGELDLTRSPFKLIAIVNRLDLAQGSTAYGGGSAGEGRFVFAAVDRTSGTCRTVPFLVIFEYGVDKSGCAAIKAYAQQWQNLSTLVLGSATYNAALEALTEQFAKRNLSPRKPNRSAINQVRTNEEYIGYPWELREFRLWDSTINPASFATPGPFANVLNSHTVAQTPDRTTKASGQFASYVNGNAPAIVATPPTYTVPLLWPATKFRGGNALVPNPLATPPFWSLPAGSIPNRQARHVFSLNTCDGCHGDELGNNFTHISWTGALSPFLSGPLSFPDRADGAPVRNFNEMLARRQNLDQVANQSCLTGVFARDRAPVH